MYHVMTWNSDTCADANGPVSIQSPPQCWACGIGARHTRKSCATFRRAGAVKAFNRLPIDAQNLLLATAHKTVAAEWVKLTDIERTEVAIDVWLARQAAYSTDFSGSG